MFHVSDNVFFGRLPHGCVRILKLAPGAMDGFPRIDAEYKDALFDFTMDADSWASVVASVSEGGEESGRFYVARAFHDGKPPPDWTQPIHPANEKYGGGPSA